MIPIDLKEKFGKQYKIGYDPAVEVGESKHDPWNYLILCKHGNIYPYSAKKLAFYCIGSGIRKKLHKEHPDIEVYNWSDDGEAIFPFFLDQFDLIAKYAKPRRKRRLSEEQKQIQVDRLKGYRFKLGDASKVKESPQISMISDKGV